MVAVSGGAGGAGRVGGPGGADGPGGPRGPVPPGTGWPGDPATPATPVARDAADVRRLAASAASATSVASAASAMSTAGAGGAGALRELEARVSVCRACPRLVSWREEVARARRRSFAAETYWGRPIPGWGEAAPRVLVVGLAPAAHGGNRTGRIFTGDRSGDWLFAALHRAGLASRPDSVTAGDGQQLLGTRMLAGVRCAPPANKPTPDERDRCAPWLDAELALVRPSLRVVVALGAFAWQVALAALARAGEPVPVPRPRFGHGARVPLGGLLVLGCFHPSQQNTFTGKLTAGMLDEVFAAARRHAIL